MAFATLLAALQAPTPLQPDVVQWWFQPQAFKGCGSALSRSLAKGPVYKVFSKTHLLKLWVNQGFIKCPIRRKIHFVWSCKGNFCTKIKRSHCQIFQRNNVYRLRLIPSSLLELQPHSVSQSKTRFWLILKCCIAEPLTRWGKWVEKLLVANR